jgi:hypothetical protein
MVAFILPGWIVSPENAQNAESHFAWNCCIWTHSACKPVEHVARSSAYVFLLFTQSLAVFNRFDTNTQQSGHKLPMISQSVLGKSCNLFHDELLVNHMLVPVFSFVILSHRFSDVANVTALVSWKWFPGLNKHYRCDQLEISPYR